jgi:hypothetical protein
MSVALVVVILVAANDARDPATTAMTATTQEALGPDAIVVVREVEAMPPDDEAERLEGTLHAEAVVEVTWPGAAHDRAHLRVHTAAASPPWAERDLAFAPVDAPAERGRTIAFTVAAMLPAPGTSDEPRPPSATPVPAPPVPPPADVAAPPLSSPRLEPRPRAAFDFAASGALGVRGNAGGLGGEIGARWSPLRSIWLVGFASAMLGDMEVAQATSRSIRLAAGAAWEPLPAGPAQPFGLGLVASLGACRHALTRTVVGAAPVNDARWIGVGQLRVELTWWFLRQTALVSSFGAELAFGATRVRVDGRTAETIPLFRGLISLGVRSQF